MSKKNAFGGQESRRHCDLTWICFGFHCLVEGAAARWHHRQHHHRRRPPASPAHASPCLPVNKSSLDHVFPPFSALVNPRHWFISNKNISLRWSSCWWFYRRPGIPIDSSADEPLKVDNGFSPGRHPQSNRNCDRVDGGKWTIASLPSISTSWLKSVPEMKAARVSFSKPLAECPRLSAAAI